MSEPASAQRRYHSLGWTLFLLLAGPIVWALHLGVIYESHAMLCARGLAQGTAQIVVAAATVAALVLLLLSLAPIRRSLGAHRSHEPLHRFQRKVASLLAALSIIAIFWAGATFLFVPDCLPLR